MSTSEVPSLGEEWPQKGLEEVERCPVCTERGRHLLHSGLSDLSYRSAPGRWQLFRCESCSCAYLDPRPDEQTAHLAYRNYYDGAAMRSVPPPRGWQRFRRALRNGYLNARYGYALAPSSALGNIVLPLFPGHREKADEHVRHLSRRPGSPRLLDVGCGEGEFLTDMQALGWAGHGVDPSSEAVAIARARGLRVTEGAFPEVPLELGSFDAVTFRLVLEHIRDPVAAVQACHRALKPRGIVWIATPSLDSEAHRLYGEHWIHLQPPRHAVVYSPASLTRLLTRSGFAVMSRKPSRHALWSFRLSAAMARGDAPFAHSAPLSRSQTLRAHLADLKALRDPGLADVVVFIARKT